MSLILAYLMPASHVHEPKIVRLHVDSLSEVRGTDVPCFQEIPDALKLLVHGLVRQVCFLQELL